MVRRYILGVFLALAAVAAQAADAPWPAGSAQLFNLAKQDESFAAAERLQPTYYPTSDGRSFIVLWKQNNSNPTRWIVSLPGTHGFATKDLVVWSRHLAGRDIGFISVQWWLGAGDSTKDYYNPFELYREIDIFMRKMQITPGSAMLHGFSRGAANMYAVAALDRAKGGKHFSLFVANSGGASPGYPPTHLIEVGEFGQQPFAGTQWVTSCGGKDTNPERDGCPAMQRTAQWLKAQGGAIAMTIEDPNFGHGALNLNPENSKKLLDFFLK